MARDDGVRVYHYYTATLPFPDGEMVCIKCPFLHRESGIERYICMYNTSEVILYPQHTRGDFCQLQYVGSTDANADDQEVTDA